MEATDGTALHPSNVFMTPAWHRYGTAQVDGNGRPLFTPVPAGAMLLITSDSDGSNPTGYTGERLLNLALFSDANIPTSGGNARLVVARMPAAFTQSSEPALRTFVEPGASTLTVVVQAYLYVGALALYPQAVQAITGARYQSPRFSCTHESSSW